MFKKAVSKLSSGEMIEAILKSSGFITAAQATAMGIQRRTLGELVEAKRLYRRALWIYLEENEA